MKIEINTHSSIRIEGEKVIYIDPFQIEKERKDADVIFVTHSHFDHFSEEDIAKVAKEDTKIVATKDLEKQIQNCGFKKENVMLVSPCEEKNICGIDFVTIPAYNIRKNFHKKEDNFVGYVISIGGVKYYIAGDTDITPEAKEVSCDVAFLPCGGMYTMDAKQAATLANILKPKIAIPTHYGSITGNKEDGAAFGKYLEKEITLQILIK